MAEQEEADVPEGRVKVAKTPRRRADSNLRVARRRLEASEWQPDLVATQLIGEANVLALLDLADAIKASKA